MRKWCLWGGAAPQKSAAEPAYQGGWHSMLSAGGGAPQITDPVLGAGGRGPAPRIQCLGGGSAPQTRYPAAITPSPFGGGVAAPWGGSVPPPHLMGELTAPPPPAAWSSGGWCCRWSRPNARVRGTACPPPPLVPTQSSTSALVGTSCSNGEHWEGAMLGGRTLRGDGGIGSTGRGSWGHWGLVHGGLGGPGILGGCGGHPWGAGGSLGILGGFWGSPAPCDSVGRGGGPTGAGGISGVLVGVLGVPHPM